VHEGSGPAYHADSLQRVTDVQSRRRLRSSSSSTLVVPVTRRATLGDRSFPVAATRVWNALSDFVTAAPTVASFCAALKTYVFTVFLTMTTQVTLILQRVLEALCACTTTIVSSDDYDDDDDDDDNDSTGAQPFTVVQRR